jgi:hypothetical protein
MPELGQVHASTNPWNRSQQAGTEDELAWAHTSKRRAYRHQTGNHSDSLEGASYQPKPESVSRLGLAAV